MRGHGRAGTVRSGARRGRKAGQERNGDAHPLDRGRMMCFPGRGLPALLAAASLAFSGAAGAAPPSKPTGPWNVDFGDAHCIAMRNYGTEAKPVILAFKPSPIGDVIQLSVVRPGVSVQVNQYPGLMTAGGLKPVPVSMLGYRAPSKKS